MAKRLDSEALERSLCATAMLMQPELVDRHTLGDDDFADPKAALVYRAVQAIHEQGERPDSASVRSWLRTESLITPALDEYLISLAADFAPLSPFEERELCAVLELRRIRRAALEAQAACEGGDLESARKASTRLATARDGATPQANSSSLREAAMSAVEDVFRRDSNRTPVPFGLENLDDQLSSLDPGTMLVIGAATGVGKSSVCLAMALGQAALDVPVGIVSLEDSRRIWGSRAAGKWCGVSPLRMRGKMEAHEYAALGQIGEHMPDPQIYIEDPIGGSEDDVCAAMRRLVHRHGVRVLYVDYVQAIRSTSQSSGRHHQVREISSRLKAQAYALDVPLVLVSQIRRREQGAKPEPTMHDLKESGDLENAAEIIVLLWLPNRSNRDEVAAKIEKSKWGCSEPLFALVRGSDGMLREKTEYDR